MFIRSVMCGIQIYNSLTREQCVSCCKLP